MTPITIKPQIEQLSIHELREKLYYQSYVLCVNADFNKTEAIQDLIINLEMLALEALLRIFNDKLGYKPLQNKIYEKTEYTFSNQDAYNINRMMSSLRRVKHFALDPTDLKYLEWFKNRVKYAVKSIRTHLKEIDYTGYDYNQEQMEGEYV